MLFSFISITKQTYNCILMPKPLNAPKMALDFKNLHLLPLPVNEKVHHE